jgi:hypothetical protein
MRKFFLFIILNFAYNVFPVDYQGHYIAHAGGGVENHNYTNTLEALAYNYDKVFVFLNWIL